MAKLASWTKKKTGGQSRAELLESLAGDISVYYGYSIALANYFLTLFSPGEAIAFFEASEQKRPMTRKTFFFYKGILQFEPTCWQRDVAISPKFSSHVDVTLTR